MSITVVEISFRTQQVFNDGPFFFENCGNQIYEELSVISNVPKKKKKRPSRIPKITNTDGRKDVKIGRVRSHQGIQINSRHSIHFE